MPVTYIEPSLLSLITKILRTVLKQGHGDKLYDSFIPNQTFQMWLPLTNSKYMYQRGLKLTWIFSNPLFFITLSLDIYTFWEWKEVNVRALSTWT